MAKQWYHIAAGDSIDSLTAFVADHPLQAGDRIVVEMSLALPVAKAFDVAPNWWPYTPDGMRVVDIWGEGWPWETNYGYVEMEANTPWLLAVIAFIRAHWVALIIADVTLAWLVSKCYAYVYTDYATTPPVPPVPPPVPNGNGESILDQMMPMMMIMMMMSMMMSVMDEAI